MKKILKFLKCKDVDEVIRKIKSYEIGEELEEFKNLMMKLSKGELENRDLTAVKGKMDLINYLRSDIGLKNTEEFKVIFLSSSNHFIGVECLF